MRSNGYDGQEWMLVEAGTMNEMHAGDCLTDFRGDTCQLRHGRAPHKPSSTGYANDCYAGVYGLKWVWAV